MSASSYDFCAFSLEFAFGDLFGVEFGFVLFLQFFEIAESLDDFGVAIFGALVAVIG